MYGSTRVDQLQFSVDHHLTTGTFREGIWKSLFQQIIPKKFSIEQSVFIVDSKGHVSNEVDLAIFDEQYTPYIFRYGNIKYIPIEAVAVVVQCKSTNVYEDKLRKWVNSVDELRTSMKSVARMYTSISCGDLDPKSLKSGMTQTATRPVKILCHTKNETPAGIRGFDIVIHPRKGKLNVTIPKEKDNHLGTWHKELNHFGEQLTDRHFTLDKGTITEYTLEKYRIRQDQKPNKEISLLSLTFQLNQLLMLINNPLLFPHLAYVEMFNRHLDEI
ncbi:DUF6602 domain-containing protein [Paenibacillus thermoaerophilus]|uniref:DUF6602 domain-containing protein n=1 Tax=Paenibacillus thermoaerophilus TaxID=1215385 RepID=A0ABW2V162_9BACL|nr:DUF6602 domain-containing protein [Paenibacillus thermoaerophilus]TMV17370.1 hypothetical protein FE781_07745 [Paenibacillus thermoaerophilus]